MSENPVRSASEEIIEARCPTCDYQMSSHIGWRQTDGRRIVLKVNCCNPSGFHVFLIPFPFAPVVVAAEEAMKEKCCKIMCWMCARGTPTHVDEYGNTIHEESTGWERCKAETIRAIPTGTALAEYVERATAELRAEMQPKLDHLNNGWRERDEYIASLKAQLAEAERKAYLKVRQALEGAGDAPIPEGVCSNEDQEEGFSDGVCCTLNLIWKAIASLEKSAALSAPAKEGESPKHRTIPPDGVPCGLIGMESSLLWLPEELRKQGK